MPGRSSFETQLNRASKASLYLLALSAPISIAATQTAWAFAILFWLIRLIFVRPKFRLAGFDLAIIAFVGLSLISSVFSYEPRVSLGKMVAVSLVTIVYLASEKIVDKRTIRKVVTILLISGVVSVAYTIASLAVGKNLKVVHLTPDSPLRAAGVEENDTILEANHHNINSPDDLASAVANSSENGIAKIVVYRFEYHHEYPLAVSKLSPGDDPSGKFGIVEWSRGRDTRAAGFYGHYITYAEVLQLFLSLALGLLIFVPGGFFSRNRVLLAAAIAALCVALFLTVTRASWAAFLVSAAVMILIGASKRTLLICIACMVPLALAGVFYLQQKRNVGFADMKDDSATWRLMVWREGLDVLVSNPRHLAVGIGMDSIKSHWQDWHMFDDGRQPIGHMHSTPLQLAFERGVPTLLIWIVWIFIYLKMLWRGVRREDLEWPEQGILLGSFGGTVGFLVSGLVQYNWGDSEVVMIFYLLMGLSLAVSRTGGQARNIGQAV